MEENKKLIIIILGILIISIVLLVVMINHRIDQNIKDTQEEIKLIERKLDMNKMVMENLDKKLNHIYNILN